MLINIKRWIYKFLGIYSEKACQVQIRGTWRLEKGELTCLSIIWVEVSEKD